MPVIPSLILTNQMPTHTYTASLVVSSSTFDGNVCKVVADGLGNQITFMDLTASYAYSASVQQSYELSSSFASQSFFTTSASFASQSMWAISSSFASQSLTSSYMVMVDYNGGVYKIAGGPSPTQGIVFIDDFDIIRFSIDNSGANGNLLGNLLGTASLSLTSSHFSPSKGAVTNAGPTTGSATSAGFGFVNATEFNDFITTTSASFQQLNSLLEKLRSAGIIT